jgi:hypothetical protein
MQLLMLSTNNLNSVTTSRPNVSTSANLKITMTIQAQDKSKKRTRYRPIERPDGVIVLQRPYRPAASSSSIPQPPQFEKHLPTFVVPATSKKPRSYAELQTADDDFAGIGAHLEHGRDGYNEPVDSGRGGYNDIIDGREELWDFLKSVSKRQGLTPMQRFLGELGSWSTFEEREM